MTTTTRLTAAFAAFATTLIVFHAVVSIAVPGAEAPVQMAAAAAVSTVH